MRFSYHDLDNNFYNVTLVRIETHIVPQLINRYKNIDSNIIFRDMASGIYFLKINFVTAEYLVKTFIVE